MQILYSDIMIVITNIETKVPCSVNHIKVDEIIGRGNKAKKPMDNKMWEKEIEKIKKNLSVGDTK